MSEHASTCGCVVSKQDEMILSICQRFGSPLSSFWRESYASICSPQLEEPPLLELVLVDDAAEEEADWAAARPAAARTKAGV